MRGTPYTSFTIGIDKPDVVRQKTKEAAEFKVLKVKLGRDTDKMIIETIRSVTDKPITLMSIRDGRTGRLPLIWPTGSRIKGGVRRTADAEGTGGRYGVADRASPCLLRRRGVQRISGCEKSARRIFRDQCQVMKSHRDAGSTQDADSCTGS